MVLDFQLQDLTQVEETLISAVLPIMSIYRLPHGQYSYSRHVTNLPQDVASFATSLPRLPSELDVVIVRKEGGVQSHRDFRVRRSVVLRALQWLVANNIYYCNVHIDPSALSALSASETPLKLSNSSFRYSAITNPLFHTSYSTWFRPQPRRTSRTAPPALHALAHPSHSSSRSPPQCCAFI